MPNPLDPATLEGDELERWYRRSPQEIEQERQIAVARRAAVFFGRPLYGKPSVGAPIADGVLQKDLSQLSDGAPGLLDGPGRYRAGSAENGRIGIALRPLNPPENPVAPEPADFIEIGNPHNPRLRREWVEANGQAWPKTDDGRNYHVAHKRAVADGGTNTLDNIEPMHPDEHLAQHINNGDSARWGLRPHIARAFGGTVEPPTPGAKLSGLGWLGLLSAITGLLSGRIRTDTATHTMYDLAGYPAPDDSDNVVDPACRALGVNRPGEKCL